VNDSDVATIGELLRRRNLIDSEIAKITARPMTAGHLGEWIAAQIFDIALEPSASTAVIDGRFKTGPLEGRTVNVKWYGKQEGLLATSDSEALDYYLVLTGPIAPAGSSKGGTRPWCIDHVYLFDAHQLHRDQAARRIGSSVAASVRSDQWKAAEILPTPANHALTLTPRQSRLLAFFASARVAAHREARLPSE
jgi:hypothetical protein